jgi:DNA-directed RNA polymerase subunit RPC12/RpoP
MHEGDDAGFSCTQCGKRFRWRAALAGKKARCPCGSVIVCPSSPPQAPQEYEPVPTDPLPVKPVVAMRALPVNPMQLAYQPAKREFDPERFKNLTLPLWLLAGGIIVQLVADLITSHGEILSAAILVGVQVIIGTAIMLVGILLAAKMIGVRLGQFWTAIFKLSAISVAPAAVVAIATPALNFIPLGFFLGWLIEFVLYFALLAL